MRLIRPVVLPSLLLVIGCSAHSPAAAGHRSAAASSAPSPPFALTAQEARARLLDKVEVMGVGAEVSKFPAQGHSRTMDRNQQDPHAVSTCRINFVHLDASAQVTRAQYFTHLPGYLDHWTHSWMGVIAVYPSTQTAWSDAQKIVHDPRCPVHTRKIARITFHDRYYVPAHTEQWSPQPPDTVNGWTRTRVLFLSHYDPYNGGGQWSYHPVVIDVAVRGRVLFTSYYFTATPDPQPTRTEQAASNALDLQLRRLAGQDGACTATPGGISCQAGRRTASPVPGR